MKRGLVVANFGGPCCPSSVEAFLTELLKDRDVIRSNLPTWIHRPLFGAIAKRRAKKVSLEYKKMGGFSPIYVQTEKLKNHLRDSCSDFKRDFVWSFHRYLPHTHRYFIEDISRRAEELDEILVFTCFAQFTYATVGSVARFLRDRLSTKVTNKMRMIVSYPTHPAFIQGYVRAIEEKVSQEQLQLQDCAILCSFHGIPQSFVDRGDCYAQECRASFVALMAHFPNIPAQMSYQSKFGPGLWLKPYTQDACAQVNTWAKGKKHVLVVPLAFTSDHIETLVEIEDEYLPILRKQGMSAHRVRALNDDPQWYKGVKKILGDGTKVPLDFLIASYCPCPAACRFVRSCFVGLCSGECACRRSSSKV